MKEVMIEFKKKISDIELYLEGLENYNNILTFDYSSIPDKLQSFLNEQKKKYCK